MTAECSVGADAPDGVQLEPTANNLEDASKLVDGVTNSQDSAIDDLGISDCITNDDGPSLAKVPRLDSQCDALSAIDSGIGTFTEESLIGGTAASQRETLDLTPPSAEIENELSAEADEQSANRIQEMTNLSEKVKEAVDRFAKINFVVFSSTGSQLASAAETDIGTFREEK